MQQIRTMVQQPQQVYSSLNCKEKLLDLEYVKSSISKIFLLIVSHNIVTCSLFKPLTASLKRTYLIL